MEQATTLTAAVIGAGAIGQQHLRVLAEMPGIQLMGAVEPSPDAAAVLTGKGMLTFPDLGSLLDTGIPDLAVVATPTDEHANVALALMAAGVNVLVEKPVAATSTEAADLLEACSKSAVKAVVGHIERFNPAILELRNRVQQGELGEIFAIATERVGPFPARIRDVGVAKDLATHDLDLVAWIGNSPIGQLAARSAHRTGRDHEDIVMVTGQLESGIPFNSVVDWLTPVKRRSIRVLGESGMFVADTVTSDLHLYENGRKRSEWEVTRTLRGVSEGNVTRFALERREPLRLELEAFCDYIRTGDPGNTVSLADGAAALRAAEQVIASSIGPLGRA